MRVCEGSRLEGLNEQRNTFPNTFRFMLDYLDRKVKELTAGNAIVEWLMCCVKCCMWCLEKVGLHVTHGCHPSRS